MEILLHLQTQLVDLLPIVSENKVTKCDYTTLNIKFKQKTLTNHVFRKQRSFSEVPWIDTHEKD